MANADGSKSGGRKKGTPNKTTVALKDAIMGAFNKAGGMDYLERVAHEDPRTFCTLLGKVLPQEVKAEVGHNGLPTQITFITPNQEKVIEHDGDK